MLAKRAWERPSSSTWMYEGVLFIFVIRFHFYWSLSTHLASGRVYTHVTLMLARPLQDTETLPEYFSTISRFVPDLRMHGCIYSMILLCQVRCVPCHTNSILQFFSTGYTVMPTWFTYWERQHDNLHTIPRKTALIRNQSHRFIAHMLPFRQFASFPPLFPLFVVKYHYGVWNATPPTESEGPLNSRSVSIYIHVMVRCMTVQAVVAPVNEAVMIPACLYGCIASLHASTCRLNVRQPSILQPMHGRKRSQRQKRKAIWNLWFKLQITESRNCVTARVS